MEFTLTKLPWYAQVGAFVVVAILAYGGFYYWYEQPVQAEFAGWELSRVRMYSDGTRTVLLRRQRTSVAQPKLSL